MVNAILSVDLPFPLLNDHFIQGYLKRAEDWQSKTRPPALYINHGEYMHRHGDALEYLAEELKAKPTGNRACVILIDTKDLIGSADEPRPSFLLLQAGFDERQHGKLHLTAYYRALEVSGFLPINLAELALVASNLRMRISSISSLSLVIHAFRAYAAAGFTRLERPKLDSLTTDEISGLVRARDVAEIGGLLAEKLRPTTVVELGGISMLRTELEASGWCGREALDYLDKAISALTQLREARRSGSHARSLAELHEDAVGAIEASLEAMRRQEDAAG
ncbi:MULTISPECIES: thymidylate synthase family protein [Micromonospora]|uniref:hypothetical protein n=1 Tax=Micromonospora TaxID=1873 RepID=UPI0024A242E5|nr:hypothetical protein [Micromonospora sp. NBRC 107095]GLZ56979.1 hypothetical protein Misp05_05550 [Micromonospora sp. NBRC 107095]